jgi:hypothetical protein
MVVEIGPLSLVLSLNYFSLVNHVDKSVTRNMLPNIYNSKTSLMQERTLVQISKGNLSL